jgi:hypothetical protein
MLDAHGKPILEKRSLTANEISELAKKDRDEVKKILKAIDKHLDSVRIKLSPRMKQVVSAMKKIP